MGQSIPGATAGAMDQRPFRTRPSAKQPPLLAKKMDSGTAPLRAEPRPACAECANARDMDRNLVASVTGCAAPE